jgi:hypothetical protein
VKLGLCVASCALAVSLAGCLAPSRPVPAVGASPVASGPPSQHSVAEPHPEVPGAILAIEAPPSDTPEGGQVADPPRAPGETAIVGFLTPGDSRPHAMAHSVHFDVSSLPVAEWGEPEKPSGFTLTPLGTDAYRLWIQSTLYAEVIVANTLGAVAFSAFTGGSFSQGAPPECGKGHTGKFPTRWSGIDPRGWTDDAVKVEMGQGDFDLSTCSAAARTTIQARAAAIVPGFVYGLRVKQGDDEALVVFLPRGALVSTGGDPNAPLNQSNTGPFTRLTFPVEAGAGSTAAARVSPAALGLWRHLRQTIAPVWSFADTAAPKEDLLVGIDVVCQAERKLGTLTLSLPSNRDPGPYATLLKAARAL